MLTETVTTYMNMFNLIVLILLGAPSIDPEVAAIKVQKHWKGFAQRRRTQRERDEELMFIGMVSLDEL